MNYKTQAFCTLLLAIILGMVIGYSISYLTADYTMTEAQAQKYCTPAEVYMVGNIQEDDLFIPASSIGRVDLKR